MGCDIHAYIEYKINEHWFDFGGNLRPGRNYYLFSLMGMQSRCDSDFSIPLKGLPSDCSMEVNNDQYLYIDDDSYNNGVENTINLEEAKQWEKSGYSTIIDLHGKPFKVTHPDWHSHSWLTLDEFKKVMLNYYKYTSDRAVEYDAILAAMQSFKDNKYNVRLIIWFDN